MMDLLREVLLGVSAAAICGGIALSLTQGAALREVVRLAAGLAVLLAVLQPLTQLRLPDWGQRFAEYRTQAAAQTDAMREENMNALRSSAAQVTERYIREQAAAFGVDCTATLLLAVGEDGVLYVTGVTVHSERAEPEAVEAVQNMIAQECGISQEMQTWEWKN